MEKQGDSRYHDIIVCASQIEHVVHYLSALLLAQAGDKPYNILNKLLELSIQYRFDILSAEVRKQLERTNLTCFEENV